MQSLQQKLRAPVAIWRWNHETNYYKSNKMLTYTLILRNKIYIDLDLRTAHIKLANSLYGMHITTGKPYERVDHQCLRFNRKYYVRCRPSLANALYFDPIDETTQGSRYKIDCIPWLGGAIIHPPRYLIDLCQEHNKNIRQGVSAIRRALADRPNFGALRASYEHTGLFRWGYASQALRDAEAALGRDW